MEPGYEDGKRGAGVGIARSEFAPPFDVLLAPDFAQEAEKEAAELVLKPEVKDDPEGSSSPRHISIFEALAEGVGSKWKYGAALQKIRELHAKRYGSRPNSSSG